jgi:hypothetical protein
MKWEGRMMENDGRVNLRYIVSTFINITMYPCYNYNMERKKEREKEGGREERKEGGKEGGRRKHITKLKSHFWDST